MAKHMSKTMAAEIAGRALEVVNPANRWMAVTATLRRHGFEIGPAPGVEVLADKTALVAWLRATYSTE